MLFTRTRYLLFSLDTDYFSVQRHLFYYRRNLHCCPSITIHTQRLRSASSAFARRPKISTFRPCVKWAVITGKVTVLFTLEAKRLDRILLSHWFVSNSRFSLTRCALVLSSRRCILMTNGF